MVRDQRTFYTVLGIMSLVGISFIYYSVDTGITANFIGKKVKQIRSISWKFVTPIEKLSLHRSTLSTETRPTSLVATTQISKVVTTFSYRNKEHDIRTSNIKSACKNVTIEKVKEDKVFENLFIDQRHQLIYCQIQKVGSTFLHRMLARLNRRKENSSSGGLPKRLKDISENLGLVKIISFISNFKKFMFVREPYGRLMSGYVDKLFAPNSVFWKGIGINVISRIRTNASEGSKNCGHDVSFPEFIRYVIYHEENHKFLDPHFTPMHRHCAPCQISYDFIGKVETIKNDALYLFETWNKQFNSNITFNDFVSDSDLTITLSHTQRLFAMKKNIIKCMPFYKAMLRTWRDLQIRGILPINVDLPFIEKESENVTETDYYEAAKKVIEGIKDRSSVKRQREESLIEAYSLLTSDDKDRLWRILETDCRIFGYDVKPPKVFDVEPGSIEIKYFNLLS